MSSSARLVRWRRVLVLVLSGLVPAIASAAARTHCHPDEKVFFSCIAGKKTVSLCGQQASGRIVSLTYRYGLPGHVENEFAATPANGQRFVATVEPVAPRAEIQEVWFDRGEFSYLMTTCLGGDCPYEAGLAVLRAQRVVSNSRCQTGPDSDGYFSSDLVEFGDGTAPSTSHTSLLQIGDDGHPVDELYPVPRGQR